jgi:ABC-type uncharacterized transport system auxiliary subunit
MAIRIYATAAFVAASALLAAGCGAVPEKRFYAMVNEPDGTVARASSPCIRSAVVAVPEIAVPYDNDRIVFRTDEYQVQYFNYDLWVSQPQEMLQQLVAGRLERAHAFSAIDPQLVSARDHLTMLTTIEALEVIAKDHLVEARLAMSFRLEDGAVDQVVWRHGFDTRRRVESKGRNARVGEMVRALNAVYNAEMATTVQLLDRFLASYPGCRPAQ